MADLPKRGDVVRLDTATGPRDCVVLRAFHFRRTQEPSHVEVVSVRTWHDALDWQRERLTGIGLPLTDVLEVNPPSETLDERRALEGRADG